MASEPWGGAGSGREGGEEKEGRKGKVLWLSGDEDEKGKDNYKVRWETIRIALVGQRQDYAWWSLRKRKTEKVPLTGKCHSGHGEGAKEETEQLGTGLGRSILLQQLWQHCHQCDVEEPPSREAKDVHVNSTQDL